MKYTNERGDILVAPIIKTVVAVIAALVILLTCWPLYEWKEASAGWEET